VRRDPLAPPPAAVPDAGLVAIPADVPDAASEPTGVVPGADAAPDAASAPRPLSGTWQRCGQLGSGGPTLIALSRDGKILAVRHGASEVLVYRTSDLSVVHTFSLERDDLGEMGLSADGSLLATSGGGRLRVQRTGDGMVLVENAGRFLFRDFAPDGQRMLVLATPSGGYGTAAVIAVPGGQVVRDYGPADDAAFAEGGGAVVVFASKRVTTFRATGSPTSFPVALDLVETFSPTGDILVGRKDTADPVVLAAYRVADGAHLWTTQRKVQPGGSLVFSPDQKTLVYVFGAETWAFDPTTGADRAAIPRRPYSMVGLALGLGATPVVVADGTGVYRTTMTNLAGGDKFPSPPGTGLPIMDLTVSPDGRRVVAAAFPAGDNTMVWDLPGRTLLRTIRSGSPTAGLSFSPDASGVLRSFMGIEEYDAAAPGNPRWTFPGALLDGTLISRATYAPRAPRQIAFGYRNEVRIVTMADPSPMVTIPTNIWSPGFAFSPDGRTIAVSGPELWTVEGARLWPPVTGPYSVEPAPYADHWMAFSPDGTLVIDSGFRLLDDPPPAPPWTEGSSSRPYYTSTRIFQATDGTFVRTLNVTRRPVFSADGAWILAGSEVNPLMPGRAFKMAEGRRITVSAFAPDGSIVAGLVTGELVVYCPQ
jgi:WD40 repeat protein